MKEMSNYDIVNTNIGDVVVESLELGRYVKIYLVMDEENLCLILFNEIDNIHDHSFLQPYDRSTFYLIN